MRHYKIVPACCIFLIFCSSLLHAEKTINALTYYYGLMEYYALYNGAVGAKELDETYIVMFPERYVSNEKDVAAKQEDIKEVSSALKKTIPAIKAGAHEYSLFLTAEFGEYSKKAQGFKCAVVKADSFLDLTPSEALNGAIGLNKAESLVARGVLFGKVGRIKLFFINAEKYKIFKYRADKSEGFLKARTDSKGVINRLIYTKIILEILPKSQYWQICERLENNFYSPGMGSDYFMLAQIKSIEAYGDSALTEKLGNFADESQE